MVGIIRRSVWIPLTQFVAALITGAMELLIGETQGYAIDATKINNRSYIGGPDGGQVACRDTSTPANDLSNVPLDSSNLTQSGTSAKIVNWNTFSGPHNLMFYSEQLGVSPWTGGTITDNTTAAPDGLTSADTYTQGAAGGHEQIFGGTTGQITFSVYLKANTATWILLIAGDDTAPGGVGDLSGWFNVSTGATGTVSNTGGASGAAISAVSVGDGWYRISLTGTHGYGTDGYAGFRAVSADGGSSVVNGALVYAWGAQVNFGSTATDYVPTTAVVSGGVRWTPHNLLLQSQTFTTAPWGDGVGSTASNTVIAPDGSLTGDTYTEGGDELFQLIDLLDATYTASVFFKAGTCTWMRALIDNVGTDENTGWFNLATGQIGTTSTSGSATNTSSTMTPVGNGWYRCTVTGTRLADNSQISIAATTGDGTHTRDTGKTINCWGAQLNRGPVSTPYLVTTSAARVGIPQGYDGQKFGILIEPEATNLFTSSEGFESDPYWETLNSSVTGSAAIAPDGSLSADRLEENASGSDHVVSANSDNGVTIVSGTAYTMSCYIKSWTRTYASMYVTDSSGTHSAGYGFNISTGAAGNLGTGGTQIVGGGASIVSVGNGWFRCSMKVTPTGVAGNLLFCYIAPAINIDGDPANPGTVNDGCYIWGAQLEDSSVATSYVPTVGATATRAVDAVQLTPLTLIPYNTSNMTVYVDCRMISAFGKNIWEIALNDANRYGVYITDLPSADVTTLSLAAGVDGWSDELGSGAEPNRMQITQAFKTNDFDASLDGGVLFSDGSGTFISSAASGLTLRFGGYVADTNEMSIGYFYRMVIVPRQVQTDSGNLVTWRYNYP